MTEIIEKCVWKEVYEVNQQGRGTSFKDLIDKGLDLKCRTCSGQQKEKESSCGSYTSNKEYTIPV